MRLVSVQVNTYLQQETCPYRWHQPMKPAIGQGQPVHLHQDRCSMTHHGRRTHHILSYPRIQWHKAWFLLLYYLPIHRTTPSWIAGMLLVVDRSSLERNNLLWRRSSANTNKVCISRWFQVALLPAIYVEVWMNYCCQFEPIKNVRCLFISDDLFSHENFTFDACPLHSRDGICHQRRLLFVCELYGRNRQ